jgi:peptide/nickel transport system permease protein
MLLLVARRLLMSVPVLVGTSLVVFSMMHLAPGDPAEAMLGPTRTEETLRQVRQALGLDRPIHQQYLKWAGGAVTGDLGTSIRLNRPVLPEVLSRLGRSSLLAAVAFVIACVGGVGVGVVSATRRGTLDRLNTVWTVLGVSIPPFFLGLLLVYVFSVRLAWLPAAGMYDVRGESTLSQLLLHMILPSIALAAAPLAVISRMVRASMLAVISQDYVRTARAKGLDERAVVRRHTLRNALVPVVSIFGLQIGYLLSATALVEIVFSWPGIGSLMVQSIVWRDLPLAQGCVLVIAVVYVLVNIASDLVQATLDPRIDLS